MKRLLVLFSFFLVMLSLASNIVADVFLCSEKVEMIEKEGKELDHEAGFEKDKIFQNNILHFGFLSFVKFLNPHPAIKITTPALGTEINPPEMINA